jgi:hypothetical protein
MFENTFFINQFSKKNVNYFYSTKVFQILYLTYHKFNGSLHDFIVLLINFESTFFYLCQKLNQLFKTNVSKILLVYFTKWKHGEID